MPIGNRRQHASVRRCEAFVLIEIRGADELRTGIQLKSNIALQVHGSGEVFADRYKYLPATGRRTGIDGVVQRLRVKRAAVSLSPIVADVIDESLFRANAIEVECEQTQESQ